MIFIFCVAIIAVYLFSPCNLAMGVSDMHLANAFIYQFHHASWLHLIVNCLSLCLMYKPIRTIHELRFPFVSNAVFCLFCYAGSVLAGVMCSRIEPTIGASGIVWYLLGVLILLRPNLQQLKNYIVVLIAFILSICFHNSNWQLHACAFVLGMLEVIILSAYDFRRLQISE